MNSREVTDSPEAIAEDRRRIRRKAMWLLFWASPVLFVILFYLVENWRGARAWKKCQEEMAAKGEKLDYASFVPPKIPVEQNFAAAPVFQMVFDQTNDTWSGSVPKPSVYAEAAGVEMPQSRWMVGGRTSLSAWQEYYSASPTLKDVAAGTNAAEAVLRVLGRFDPILEEVRQHSSRPLSRYPVKYNGQNPMLTLVPHLSFGKTLVQVFGLRSRAGLELGRVDQAAADVDVMLRLAESLKGEPNLVSLLVRIAEMEITENTIWEGMQEHQWTDVQLQRWQRLISQTDQASEMLEVIRAERAQANTTLLSMYANPGSMADMVGEGVMGEDRAGLVFMRLIPRGWYDMERTSLVRLHQDLILDPIQKRRAAGKDMIGMMDGLADGMASALVKTNMARVLMEHRFWASFVMASLERTFPKAARAQTMAQLTATACALERHRLATDGYPESLDDLLPEIKADLIQKGPAWEKFKYRKTADGRFLLYSVGLDQKDDGGEVIRKGTSVDFESGDLVWPVAKPLVVAPEKKADETAR